MSDLSSNKPKIAVIGGGSWATALVKILTQQSVRIRWWLRSEQDVAYIKAHRSNPKYLSDIAIHQTRVRPSTNLKKAFEESDTILLVTPGAFIKEVLAPLPPSIFEGKTIVSAIKGLIPDEQMPVTDWLIKHKGVSKSQLAIVAGPCHAEEVALERLSYLTIGCHDRTSGEAIAQLLRCDFIRCSVSQDLDGIEYAAILKNVIALACGIAHGLNHGDNFQAVLVANAVQEMERFVNETFPIRGATRDLNQSAYLGDLLVTAYSQFSRNRTFGNMIGRGYSVQSAQMEMKMIAEGYYAVDSLQALNQSRAKVSMPILETTYAILYGKTNPALAFERLKARLS